ncbi:GIY-YIG nuclease family protein [uncultured Ruminococcus sp.]|uniref:GIY-YIG nuclease family protein n=1 Tax=uncultured Ruminococcus sp. TaxID=165186 RepID=UPI002930CC82|nr:GIY-YIG nuclease family protein [uncultured Ruminococcus sp.]
MSYFVYMMSNQSDDVLYTGVTNDLIRRVYEHKTHMDPKAFTTRYNIEKLVYYEQYSEPEYAIAREKQIKGWNRVRKNKYISEMNPDWKDLYEEIIG